jgi:nucleotide-binding universal stress UspA family protein
MATLGKHGVQHFIDGSISEDVANYANLPVMTFRI